MHKPFIWSLLIFCIAIASPAQAKEIAVIASSVSIPIGQTHDFVFGTLPQMGTTVLLKISSRINSPTLGGSSGFMKVELNGREVTPAKSHTAVRLINKPLVSPVTSDASVPWYTKKSGWNVVYAPDFEAALQQEFYADNPYSLVLDVTDLMNPVAENRLKITNLATDVIQQYAKSDAALVIGTLEVETKPFPSPMMADTNNFKPIINRGEPATGAMEYSGAVLPGGGFELKTGKSTFKFNSAFSFPNAGFNHLNAGAVDRSGQKVWQVKRDANTNHVVAQSADYRIERTIKFEKTHAEISDSITNLHKDAPLGMAVRNEMILMGLEGAQIRLAGNPDPETNDYYAPGNPSVHVRLKNSGVGMIAEDDVFRNQALLYTRVGDKNVSPVAGIRTEMLRLSPGETYSLRWAVYPVAGPDYFDFINLVRNDWGANFAVNGACWYVSVPEQILNLSLDDLRDTLKQGGIREIMLGSWVDSALAPKTIGFGTAVMEPGFAGFRKRLREATKKLHQASPGIKVTGYYDVQRDSSENSSQKFADSALIGADGKQLSTNWGGDYNTAYSMVPTLENSFGKAALETAQRYMDDLGLDGIYWDEMEATGFNAPLLGYKVFDGYSCQLDPKTWTIAREVGISGLASKAFRLAVIDAIKKKGGVVLANGPSGELDELHTHTPHMIEIQHNEVWSYQGNLQAPLGYLDWNFDWKNFLRAFNQTMLPISALPYDSKPKQYRLSHDILPYIYPFTPIELHAGYLLGKERIITTHSGDYGWTGEKVLSLSHHFDVDGKLTATHFPLTITSKEARTLVKLEDNEAAVMERIPVVFAPATKRNLLLWNATATVNQYDNDGIAIEINAPNGGVLTIMDGRFSLANSPQVAVQLSKKPFTAQVKNKILSIVIPVGFHGACSVIKK